MSTLSTQERVLAVIRRTFNVAYAQDCDELRLGSLPVWDSLGHMQLVVALEEEFGLSFPSYLLPELANVPAIVKAIETPA